MSSKIRNFQIQNRLGSGSYGVIFKAINKNNQELCVMKQIRMNKMNQKTKKSTLMQATIMGKLIHPFIVQYKDSFIQNDTLHIVMQFCDNGDLSMYLKLQNKKPLKQQKIWKFFIQICMGLQYIHRNKILHRDIKTLNIFLNKNEDIKIGDLGVAKILQANDFAQTIVGTPYYLSPQLCQQKPYNQKSDIWALGCLLYQLCTYKHPFQAANQASLILKIIRGKYNPIPEFYSKQLKDMIDLCLQRDYKRRPTANMILSRQKIKQYIKDFGLQEKVNIYYDKLKSSKEVKPQIIKQQIKKDPPKIINSSSNQVKPIQKVLNCQINQVKPQKVVNAPIIQIKSNQKEQNNIVKKVQQNLSRKIEEDKKAINQLKAPVSKTPDTNIILPDKNRIIQRLQPSNLQKNKYLNVAKPQQNDHVKQSKEQFLKKLQYAVEQSIDRKISSKDKNKIEQTDNIYYQQKSKLQKIDNKIKEEFKKQKDISKIQKNILNEKRKSQVIQIIPTPYKKAKAPTISQIKGVNILNKQDNKLIKALQNPLIPPLPPKNKDQVIKVKMEQPPIVPKVYQLNSVNSKGIIKSKGFSQQLNENNSRGKKIQINNKKTEVPQKPILFGLDDNQNEKKDKLPQNTPKKRVSQAGLSLDHYHSEKNINKLVEMKNNIQNGSKLQLKKLNQHYLFKKKPQVSIHSNSRVRKGSSNYEVSRYAKNASKSKQVSKQQQDLVANLPDSIGNNYMDNSSDQQLGQPNQINMNKKFQLKQINNSIVLQKYEQILSQQSIKQNKNQLEKKNLTPQPKHKQSSQFQRINKNLNQYNQQEQKKIFKGQQQLDDQQINKLLNINKIVHKKSIKQELIEQNESLAFKTQQPFNQDQIYDQSEEMIDYNSNRDQDQNINYNDIQQEIYEGNKFNFQDQIMKQQTSLRLQDNQNFNNQLIYTKDQTKQEWSFDQQPELPMLQQKQSPFFEQANPYLVPEQQQTVQQKKNYLQIRLQENMKRQDQINKLMQIKIQQCKSIVPKNFDQILQFFRKKINMDDQYTENDQRQVEQFLRKKGLTDQRKFQNIYKIMHFQMQLQNTRNIIQRICKKLNQLD